jgi:hypothetical protein
LQTTKSAILVAAAIAVGVAAVPVAAAVAPHHSAKTAATKPHTTGRPRPPSAKVAESSAPPRAGGYFKTLPPGAPLPSGAECARLIHRSTWEPRPENNVANHTVVHQPVKLPDNEAFDQAWQEKYKPRINGDFTGTTDEIIQWASCKWGISDDLTRARVTQESSWDQSTVGDYEPRSNGHCAKGWSTVAACPTSFGLLQSKWYFRPGVYPGVHVSTAFNVDSVLAETRGCLDGMMWFGPVSRGNVWGCVGVWYSGAWAENDAPYIERVHSYFTAKPWLSWKG